MHSSLSWGWLPMAKPMADDLVIQRATRAQVKLRISLQAVSGGGKTASALLLAKGMVAELGRRGKLPDHLDCHIGLLDTERDSASLYSHLVEFDTLPLAPPYTVERYLEGLTKLIRAGYSVIIMDQITHEWHGDGGILSWVRDIQSKGGNEYTAWKEPSEAHDRFIDAILNCPTHIICTMRSKTAYELERNDKGKLEPKRVGLQARQREGTEYEFTVVLDLASKTNAATCHKDRTELFKVGEVVPKDPKPPRGSSSLGVGVGWGEKLIEWVYTATKPAEAAPHIAAEDRCVAVADAGIRACERAPNMPDLQNVYVAQVRAVRAFQGSAGSDVVKREEARVTAAKDARKAALGSTKSAMIPDVVPVTPDDVDTIDALLMLADIPAKDFKDQYAISRIAMLPYDRYEEAITWVIDTAGGNGVELTRPPRVQMAPPPAATSTQTAKAIVERHGAEKSANDLLAGIESDLASQP